MGKFSIQAGRVEQARQVASPNQNARPDPSDISLLVIHNVSLPPGQFGGNDVEALFTNTLDTSTRPEYEDLEGLTVSAHLFVRRDGECIQFVSLDRRAWHAGVSRFEGREGCNDFSIGIELEGTDATDFTDVQYSVLVDLTQAISATYPLITPSRIVGHSDIAPGRKTDPGPHFDWQRFRSGL